MKGDLIVEGGVYAWKVGKYGQPQRCLVLDRRPIFDNRYSRLWLRENVVYALTRPSRRFLVAVEFPCWVDEDGAIWEGETTGVGSRSRYRASGLPAGTEFTEWLPWAARSVELVSTWDDEIVRRAEAEKEQAEEDRRRGLAEEARRRRNQEEHALGVEERAWRKSWHEEVGRRREIETHRLIVARIAEIVANRIPGANSSAPTLQRIAEDVVEEFAVDLRSPLPHPFRSLFSGS